MKFFLLSLLMFTGCLVASSQSQEIAAGDSIPWELRKQSFIYNSAKLFNDPIVARIALYNLLAENPKNVSLYDSLAFLYFQYNQYASAALVAEQRMGINSNSLFAIEIAALSFDNIGVKNRALDNYEKLYLSNGNVNTLYKISYLQLELDRFSEAETSLDIIIGNPESAETIISFSTTEDKNQEVSLKIAAHRLKAMLLEKQGNIEQAKLKYIEVLNMKPGFQVVQQQLRDLNKTKE